MEIIITREELYNMIWTEPMSSLARKYQISDTGLRKKCIKLNIPLPPYGYWSKLKYSKSIKQQKLPKEFIGNNEIVLCYRDKDGNYVDPEESPFKRLKKEIENDQSLNLKVPKRLSKPDPLIISIKKYFQTQNPSHGRYEGVLETHYSELKMRVTPKLLGRALRIMDTFIKLVKARNHKIETQYDRTLLIIGEIEYKISLKEKFRINKTENRWSSQRYKPTGILALRKEGIFEREWKDGKLLLEDKLSTILVWLELDAKKRKEELDFRREQQRIKEEQERIEKEIKARKNKELKKVKKLVKIVKRWHQSKLIREYIDYIGDHNQDTSKELKTWLIWAKDKADWYDPIVAKEDEILGFYDRK